MRGSGDGGDGGDAAESKVGKVGEQEGEEGEEGDGEAGAGPSVEELLEKMKVEELLQGAEAGSATLQAHARRFAAQKRRRSPRHHARDAEPLRAAPPAARLRRAGPRASELLGGGSDTLRRVASSAPALSRRDPTQSDPEALALREMSGSTPEKVRRLDKLRADRFPAAHKTGYVEVRRARWSAPHFLEPPEKEGASRKARWMQAVATPRQPRPPTCRSTFVALSAGALSLVEASAIDAATMEAVHQGTQLLPLADAEIWLVDMPEAEDRTFSGAPLRYQIIVRVFESSSAICMDCQRAEAAVEDAERRVDADGWWRQLAAEHLATHQGIAADVDAVISLLRATPSVARPGGAALAKLGGGCPLESPAERTAEASSVAEPAAAAAGTEAAGQAADLARRRTCRTTWRSRAKSPVARTRPSRRRR